MTNLELYKQVLEEVKTSAETNSALVLGPGAVNNLWLAIQEIGRASACTCAVKNVAPEGIFWKKQVLAGGGVGFSAPAPGDIYPERPTTDPGQNHRWHFADGAYRCWDCPAQFGFPQNAREVKERG